MNQRIDDLLRASADDLAVPAPDAAAVLRRGRGARRRRRAAAVGSVAALALAVGAGGALLTGQLGTGERTAPGFAGDGASVEPATGPVTRAYLEDGAVALQNLDDEGRAEVRLGHGAGSVMLDDPPSYLAQTSVGPVAIALGAAGEDTATIATRVLPDAGAAERLSLPPITTVLVRGDATTPRIAWAEVGDGDVSVTVWDVERDRRIAAGAVSGAGDLLTGDAVWPIVDGDRVYLPGRTTGLVYLDVRDGSSGAIELPGTVLDVDGGLAAVAGEGGVAFHDLDEGVELGGSLGPDVTQVLLSPDGRHAVYDQLTDDGASQRAVVDTRTGERVPVPDLAQGGQLTWTPAGRVLTLSNGALQRCDLDTGTCTSEPLGTGTEVVPIIGDYWVAG